VAVGNGTRSTPGERHELPPLRLLIVEDDPGDAALLRRYVGRAYDVRELVHVERIVDAFERLQLHTPDVVLLDLSLPDSHGLATFNDIRIRRPDLPIVVISGLDDEEVAAEAVKAGAQDYLVKGTIDAETLARAIRYAIERNRTQVELQDISATDDLTGLLNRRGFVSVAQRRLLAAQRSYESMALVFIDLDGLKAVNDAHGHTEGSRLIADAADAIRSVLRPNDLAARLGGDEFCLLLTGGDPTVQLLQSQLGRAIDRRNQTSTSPSRLSLSLGAATSRSGDRRTLDALVQEADARMYEQKRAKHAERRLPASA
jgi:diguanylate cyclase (GGDEF)-like protein